MKRQIVLLLTGILMLTVLGCAKPKVWVAPRIDLHECGTLGMIELHPPLGYGPLATQQFVATLHSAQGSVPVLELGRLTDALHSVGHRAVGPDAIPAIGEKYQVDVVVVGDLEIDEPRPDFSIQSFTEANASADILGTLHFRFLDARSGATIRNALACDWCMPLVRAGTKRRTGGDRNATGRLGSMWGLPETLLASA